MEIKDKRDASWACVTPPKKPRGSLGGLGLRMGKGGDTIGVWWRGAGQRRFRFRFSTWLEGAVFGGIRDPSSVLFTNISGIESPG